MALGCKQLLKNRRDFFLLTDLPWAILHRVGIAQAPDLLPVRRQREPEMPPHELYTYTEAATRIGVSASKP
eukprot:1782599-Prymnesium_polylepis.1